MSAHSKTSGTAICQAVRALLEKQGERGLSMQAIANAVGIRAPSLYKRFANRADLLKAAAHDANAELRTMLSGAIEPGQAYRSLERMAHAYRKFVKKNARIYPMMRAETVFAEMALAPLAIKLGKETAPHAARALAAYLHGYLSMEVEKSFSGGGLANDAFQYGLSTLLRGLLGSVE